MRAIISLVEGEGDEKAVPSLIHKVLSDNNRWDWYAGPPIKVRSLGALRKRLRLHFSRAAQRKNCEAMLVLLDSDDDCPKEEAKKLAAEIRSLNLAQPVAIVFAHREYEAWFLASLPTIAGHHNLSPDVVYEGDVEAKRDVKGWFKKQMSRDRYNPSSHQKKLTKLTSN